MKRNIVVRLVAPLLFGVFAVGGGQTFAQEQGEQQQAQELSEQAQKATARLHALAEARGAFSTAAAQQVEDRRAQEFLQMRAGEYARVNEDIISFAETAGVNLESAEMQAVVGKYRTQWMQELGKVRTAEPPDSARLALETFIQRNEKAVEDLKTVRREVQEQEVTDRINQMVASLEEETTQAENLHQRLQSAMEQEQEQR